MNNINLLQTIAKLCDKKTLSINERKIDETAKQNAMELKMRAENKFKQLSLSEQAAVKRLMKLGFDKQTVMDVYLESGKDELIAREILTS